MLFCNKFPDEYNLFTLARGCVRCLGNDLIGCLSRRGASFCNCARNARCRCTRRC